MAYEVVPYTEADLDGMIAVWNEVVEEGMAFPQMETLDHKTGVEFFGKQDFVGVAKVDGEVAGLYILHPNNVGRCGHHFNAVVKGNDRAIRLYEKLGFRRVGAIPGGFLLKTGEYQDIFVYYHTL